MTTVYYPEDHKHTLPSLSQLMPQSHPISPQMSNIPFQSDVFSNSGSQPSTAKTTPATSFSGQSSSSPANEKCTCKSNANRIPRPRNAFILFRQKYHQSVLDEGTVIRTNPEVSRELGRRWRSLSVEEKDYWNNLAEEEKATHAKKYPNYRYSPRRNGKSKGCEACRQKALRQQQAQLHNQQMLQMQQDQYQQYIQLQQQAQVQQLQQQQVQQLNQHQQLNQQLGQQQQRPLPQQQQQQQQLGQIPGQVSQLGLTNTSHQQLQPQTQQQQQQQQQQMLTQIPQANTANGSISSQVAPPPLPQQYVQYIPFQQNFQLAFGDNLMQSQTDQKLSLLSAPNTGFEGNQQFSNVNYEQRYYAPGMEMTNYPI